MKKILVKPPKRRLICPVCDKETTFKYIPLIKHSECLECGATWKRKENLKRFD